MTGRVGRFAPAVVALSLFAGACGVPEDTSPRELSAESLVPETNEEEPTPTPPPPQTELVNALIYLLDENGLVSPVIREVPLPAAASDVTNTLITGPTDEEVQQLNLSSAIPPTTVILSTTLADGTLTLNVGPEGLFQLEGDEQKRAIAQLVYTTTELDDVDDVLLQIEGEFRPLPTDEADTTELQPVDRSDYVSLDPILGADTAEPS